jgi:Leucine-rich repeat (LRR) protein
MHIVDMKNIPLTLFCLNKLRVLSIQRSATIELLASSLVKLRIHETPIITLPDQIGKLKLLDTMELHWTGFVHFPTSISTLSSLRILSLIGNDIASLPTSMRQMTSLTHLTLSNNPRLTSLETINGHPSLTVLIANNCSFEQIPQNLPKLKGLYLSNNDLTSLDGIETLGNASNTSIEFYFSRNRIGIIPTEILLVKNLAVLNLNNNTLSYLPEELMRLPSLAELHLKDNADIYWEVVELKTRMEIIRPTLEIIF